VRGAARTSIGKAHGLDRIVRHEEPYPRERDELAPHEGPEVCSGPHVECRERLVEQEEPWLADQSPGQRYPLRLAAGQVGGPGVGPLDQIQPC
jgi:hypothetical protein